MSPEQIGGGRKRIDHRVDIYSLGTTLYEWLAGRPAFESDDRIEVLQRIARTEPAPLRKIDATIPIELETIVHKAMAKSPGDRYATAGELAADLARFINNEPIFARRPGVFQRAAKWPSRRKNVVLGAVLLLLASALLGQGAWRWRDRVLRGHTGLLTAALTRADRSEHASEHIRYWVGAAAAQADSSARISPSCARHPRRSAATAGEGRFPRPRVVAAAPALAPGSYALGQARRIRSAPCPLSRSRRPRLHRLKRDGSLLGRAGRA